MDTSAQRHDGYDDDDGDDDNDDSDGDDDNDNDRSNQPLLERGEEESSITVRFAAQ